MSVSIAPCKIEQAVETPSGVYISGSEQVFESLYSSFLSSAQPTILALCGLDGNDPKWGEEDAADVSIETRLSAAGLIRELGRDAIRSGKTIKMPSYAPLPDGRIALEWKAKTHTLQVFIKDAEESAKVITTSSGGQKTESLRFSLTRQRILSCS